MRNPFRCSNRSPEVIRLTVLMYVRYPLLLRQVEDLLVERGIDIVTRRCGSGETGSFRCRRGDPQAAGSKPIIVELALAPGRGACPDRWRDSLSLAGC
jgi:hypothetical protein